MSVFIHVSIVIVFVHTCVSIVIVFVHYLCLYCSSFCTLSVMSLDSLFRVKILCSLMICVAVCTCVNIPVCAQPTAVGLYSKVSTQVLIKCGFPVHLALCKYWNFPPARMPMQ